MKARGRPILGGFAGLLFGLFLAVELLALGTLALDSMLLALLPVLFLIVGVVWAIAAPLRSGKAAADAPRTSA